MLVLTVLITADLGRFAQASLSNGVCGSAELSRLTSPAELTDFWHSPPRLSSLVS